MFAEALFFFFDVRPAAFSGAVTLSSGLKSVFCNVAYYWTENADRKNK